MKKKTCKDCIYCCKADMYCGFCEKVVSKYRKTCKEFEEDKEKNKDGKTN